MGKILHKANDTKSESAKRWLNKEIGTASLMLEVRTVVYRACLFMSNMETVQQGINRKLSIMHNADLYISSELVCAE